VINLVNEGRGRLFRRNGKFLIYLPKDLAEDSMFPFKNWEESRERGARKGVKDSVRVKVSFKSGEEEPKLLIEEWKEET